MISKRTFLATSVLFASFVSLGNTALAADDVTIGIAVNNLQSDFPNQIIQAARDDGIDVVVADRQPPLHWVELFSSSEKCDISKLVN